MPLIVRTVYLSNEPDYQAEMVTRFSVEKPDPSDVEFDELLKYGWESVRKNKLFNERLERRYTPLQVFTRDIVAFVEINPDLITDYAVIEQQVLAVLRNYARRSGEEYYKSLSPDHFDYDELENYLNCELVRLFIHEDRVTKFQEYNGWSIGLKDRSRLMVIVADEAARLE